ncbi:MAG: HEAT repeat domain-containing protein [Planctomycetota bacterium]
MMKRRWVLCLFVLGWVAPCLAAEATSRNQNHPSRIYAFAERGDRIAELYRLGLDNKPESIPVFCSALKDGDVKMREAAVKQLVFTNDETAVAPLIEALKDESAIVRRCAISALRRIGAQEAVPALVETLTYVPAEYAAVGEGRLPQQEYTNRLAAALELYRLGSDAGRETVLKLLKTSQDKPVLTMALRCAILMQMKEAIPEAIRIARATPFFGEDTPGLFALRLARILDDGAYGKELAELALEKNDSTGGFVKVETLCLLSKYGDERAIPIFKQVIEYDDAWEQHPYWAVKGLERLNPEGTAAYLVNTVLDLKDRNPNSISRYEYFAFKAACDAVGRLGDASVIPDLKRILPLYIVPSDYFAHRLRILRTLASLGDAEGLASLQKSLAHKDAAVRRFAAKFLGELGSAESAPLIAEAVKKETEPYTFRTMKAILSGLGALTPELEALPEPALPRQEDTYKKPRFIGMNFDDCATVEAIERFADLVEEFAKEDVRWVFSMWYAPLSRNDVEYNKVLVQRCFDRGCEIENHSLHHNPDVRGMQGSTDEELREEIPGNNKWIKANILGVDKIYRYYGGGGGERRPGDPVRTREEIRKIEAELDLAKDIPYGDWKADGNPVPMMRYVDGSAPPFHFSKFTDVFPRPAIVKGRRIDFGPIAGLRTGGDLAWMYDFETAEEGVEAFAASFDYWYYHMPTWVFFLGGHDWPNSPIEIRPPGHQVHWEVLSGFLRKVLVERKDQYDRLYSMTQLEMSAIFNTGKTPEEILTSPRNLQTEAVKATQ